MSTLFQFIQAGGIIMVPLLLLSLGAIAVIVERVLAFNALGHTPHAVLKRVIDLARQHEFAQAIQICDETRGPLAAALGAILKHRDRPVAVAERQVEDVGQDYFIRLERLLPFLDTTYRNAVKPRIPAGLLDLNDRPYVRVRVEIAADGSFTPSIRTGSGNAQVDELTLAALRKWRWKPALKDGEPIASAKNFRVNIE